MYILPCHVLATPDAAASTASHPACLTIAIRPSSGTRRFGYELIRTRSEHIYFLIWGLTAQITPDLGASGTCSFRDAIPKRDGQEKFDMSGKSLASLHRRHTSNFVGKASPSRRAHHPFSR